MNALVASPNRRDAGWQTMLPFSALGLSVGACGFFGSPINVLTFTGLCALQAILFASFLLVQDHKLRQATTPVWCPAYLPV